MIFISPTGNVICNNKNEEAACCKEKFDNWTIWRDVMIKKKKISNSAGFTLAELMVVMAVIGVLSAVGIPSFLRGMPERRMKHTMRNLYADLQRARLQAVKENKGVTVRFFSTSAKRGYFLDEDGDSAPSAGELIRDLTDSGVEYGCNATQLNDWRSNTEVPDKNIPSFGVTGDITFTNLGEANSEDVYLQSKSDATVCYAVTVSSLGVAKILRYSDSVSK